MITNDYCVVLISLYSALSLLCSLPRMFSSTSKCYRCILGCLLLIFPSIIPRMHVLTRLQLLFLHACPKKAIFLLIIYQIINCIMNNLFHCRDNRLHIRSSATQDMQCMLVTGPGSILMGGHQPLVVELDIESHTEIRQVSHPSATQYKY